jgi:hypothetical protein
MTILKYAQCTAKLDLVESTGIKKRENDHHFHGVGVFDKTTNFSSHFVSVRSPTYQVFGDIIGPWFLHLEVNSEAQSSSGLLHSQTHQLSSIFFLVGLEFELRALRLQSRHSTT